MQDIMNFNFDSDGDGVLDSIAQGADLDGDGVMETLLVDLEGDGIIDIAASDLDGNGELETFVGSVDTDQDGEADTFLLMTDTDGDQAPDTMEIYDFDEETGELELIGQEDIEDFAEAEDFASEETDLDNDLAEFDERLNKGVQKNSVGASEGTCRASHTNQNYCVFAGF